VKTHNNEIQMVLRDRTTIRIIIYILNISLSTCYWLLRNYLW